MSSYKRLILDTPVGFIRVEIFTIRLSGHRTVHCACTVPRSIVVDDYLVCITAKGEILKEVVEAMVQAFTIVDVSIMNLWDKVEVGGCFNLYGDHYSNHGQLQSLLVLHLPGCKPATVFK
jgi:hypothetical protein